MADLSQIPTADLLNMLQQHAQTTATAPQQAPIPSNLQVDSPAQNFSNIGAESLQQAGIKPQLTDAQTTKARVMSAIPFNLGDEFASGVSALKNVVKGQAPGYSDALAANRDVLSRYSQAKPIESMAAGIPGNVMAGAMFPGGAITQGAATGAAQGFGAGQGGFLNRLMSGAQGTAVGAGTAGVLKGVGKTLSNPKVSPDVQLLLDEGIPLTPGQVAGGVAKKTEDIATSIPLMGDLVANRQADSLNALNRAVANRSLTELPDVLKEQLPKGIDPGRDSVAYVRGAMSRAYKTVLGQMSASPDQTFAGEIQNATQTASSVLPDAQMKQFAKIVQAQIADKVAKAGGTLDGDALKGIESELTEEIKGYGAGSWDEQKLAAALGDVKSAFRNLLMRQNPDQAPRLSAVDRAYAQYAILRKAGSAVGNDNGVFTPAQLLSAVKSADASAGKGNFASGTARMQDLADAAKNVLPSKYPDSGTARRVMQGGVLTGLGTGAYLTGQAIPAAGALAAGSALYTRPGNELARAVMAAQRPAAVSATGTAMQKASPMLAAITAFLASQRGY